MNPLNRYQQTQASTASRERLMVMLFEAALRHIRTGAASLEAGNNREAQEPLHKASDIVVELMSTLDRARAPELCEHLASVYLFVSSKLLSASIGHQAADAREAERAFAPLVEAFSQAVNAASAAPQAVAR